jgi:hypothetical protein
LINDLELHIAGATVAATRYSSWFLTGHSRNISQSPLRKKALETIG